MYLARALLDYKHMGGHFQRQRTVFCLNEDTRQLSDLLPCWNAIDSLRGQGKIDFRNPNLPNR